MSTIEVTLSLVMILLVIMYAALYVKFMNMEHETATILAKHKLEAEFLLRSAGALESAVVALADHLGVEFKTVKASERVEVVKKPE